MFVRYLCGSAPTKREARSIHLPSPRPRQALSTARRRRWARRPPRPDDTFEPDWVLLALDAIARRTPTPARTIALRVSQGGKSADFLVRGGKQGTTISRGDGPARAVIETRFDALLRILSTRLPLGQAMSEKLARVEGSMVAARSLPLMFDLGDRRRS